MKVYVVTGLMVSPDGSDSMVCGVFDSEQKAIQQLKEARDEEVRWYEHTDKLNHDETNIEYDDADYFFISGWSANGCDNYYTEYRIIPQELK